MTRVTILRHGETHWNRLGRLQGRSDIPLSAVGREQARRAAQELAGDTFDAIVTSPLRRATETAQVVAQRLGMDLRRDDRLAEIDMGTWAGRTSDEVAAQWPEHVERFRSGLDYRRSGTGETASEVADRATDAVVALAQKYPKGHVLVVSHGFLTQLLLSRLLGIAGHGSRLGVLGNAQRAVVQHEHGRWMLLGYNLGAGGLPAG